MEKIILSIVCFLSAVLGIFFLYFTFVILPVAFYTNAECLRKGYPKEAVTIGLERYCMNLDGSVTVRVEKASKEKQ